MRIIFLSLMLMTTISALAQPELSLKLFPVFSSNRIEDESDSLRITDDGTGLRIGVGLMADFPLTENYYFSTGVSYVAKKAGMVILNGNTQQASKQVVNLRYVQIPLSMKLYTNEMSLDTRFYFQFGILAEFKVGENEKEGDAEIIEDFTFFDTSLLFGAGVERKLGTSTAAYAGLTFQRGLIDVVSDNVPLDTDLSMKTGLFGLEVGLKF